MTHQQPVNITEKLNKIEQNIKDYQTAQTRIVERIEGYRKQYTQIGSEIQAMGANPQTIEDDLRGLSQTILHNLKELEDLLPSGLVEQLEQELNRPIQATVDLPDFGIEF